MSGCSSHHRARAAVHSRGAAKRVHLLTGLDHAAVHQAGHERGQLPGGDRDHDLVQQRQARSRPAPAAIECDPAGGGRRRSGPRRRSARRSRRRRRRPRTRPRSRPLRAAARRPAAADSLARRIARVTLQQALGTGEPAGRAARLAAHEKTKAKPERAADGASAFAGVQIRVVSTFKRTEVLVVATEPGTPPSPAARDRRPRAAFPGRRGRVPGTHRPRHAADSAGGHGRARGVCRRLRASPGSGACASSTVLQSTRTLAFSRRHTRAGFARNRFSRSMA